MTCRKFCIVIALMVLSISAIVGAKEISLILGRFSSTLNGVPVQVKMFQQGKGTITTMRTEDLVENLADYDGRFVRFMGTVRSIDVSESKQVLLKGADILVYPLDARHVPMEYQEGHVYEFTGFLTGYLASIVLPDDTPEYVLCIYAFEIRHHGKSESLREEERIEDAGSEDPLD